MESPCADNAEHQNVVAISALECPVCLDVSKGAIFKCDNGHIICLRCLRKLAHKKCPTCRVTYTWPPERDKAAEAEVSKLNLPEECRNIVSGCKFTAHGLDIVRSHEIDCLFRPVPCPYSACQKKVPLTRLEHHVTEDHLAKTPLLRDGHKPKAVNIHCKPHLDEESSHWKLSVAVFDEILFFPSLLKKDGVYYAWMKVAGGPQVARKYEVRLALDGANSGVHFTGKVFPIDVPNDEVVGLKHDILSFSTAQALQSRRSDVNGAHFIRLSYAVSKKTCEGSSTACPHCWDCEACTFRNCWLKTPGSCLMCGQVRRHKQVIK